MAEVMEFMPNGNVTLILTRQVKASDAVSTAPTDLQRNAPLAISQRESDHDGPESSLGVEPPAPPPEEFDDTVYYAPDPPGAEDGPSYPPPRRAARGSDASSGRDRSASPPAAFWASLRKNAHVIAPIEDDEDDELKSVMDEPLETKVEEEVIVATHEVHCVVSSMHLMLASEYFRTMLGGDSKEAVKLKTKGRITIRLKIDLDTMVILLNIIHGASRKVPRQVTLASLTQIAILAKGLGMLEAVEFFSDTWIDNLTREGFPKVYNDRVLPFLFVFWVFNRPVEFADMTRLAERESTDKLQDDVKNLPISKEIIAAIQNARKNAMQAAINSIHTLIKCYLDGRTLCDGSLDDELRYACDAMILGSLLKSSRKIGIWPMPEAPFNDWKFKNLARKIRAIRILDVCNKSSSRRWTSHGPGNNSHGLEDEIEESLKALERTLDGLKLSDYARNSDDLVARFHELLGPSVEYEVDQIEEDTSHALINFHEENVDEPLERDTGSQFSLSEQPKEDSELREAAANKHLEAEDAQAEFDALMKPRHRMHWEDEFREPQPQSRASQNGFSAESSRNSRSHWEDEAIGLEREASQDEYIERKPRYQAAKEEKGVSKPLESVEFLESEFKHAPKRKSQVQREEGVPEDDQYQRNKIAKYKYPAVPERKSSIGKEDDWFKAQHVEDVTRKNHPIHSKKRESTIQSNQNSYEEDKTLEKSEDFPERFAFRDDRTQSSHTDWAARAAETMEAYKDNIVPKQILQSPRDQRLSMTGNKRHSHIGYMAPEHKPQLHMEEEAIGVRDNRKSGQNGYGIPERQLSPRFDSIKRKELAREQTQTNGHPREYARSPLRTEVPLQARLSPPAVEKLKQEARVEPRRSRDFQQPQQAHSSPERLVIQETLNEFIASPRHTTHHQLQQSPTFPLDRSQEFHSPLFGELSTSPKESPRQSPTLSHKRYQENQQSHIQEDKIVSRQSPRQSLAMARDHGQDIANSNGDEMRADARVSPTQSPVLTHRSISDHGKESAKTTPRHSPTQEFRQPPISPLSRNPPSPVNYRIPSKLPTPPLSSPMEPNSAREQFISSKDHSILAERKINMVSSFTDSLRNEVKSPVNESTEAPKLGSIEEMIEKIAFPPHSNDRVNQETNPYRSNGEVKAAYTAKDHAKFYPERDDIRTHQITDTKPSLPENRETLKDTNGTDHKSTERKNVPEEEEHDLLWAQTAPPKNFKMRKSKKTFTTRY